jgi:hypothetical protein
MQNSYIHLRPIMAIYISIIDFFEYIEALLNSAEDCVFACEGGDIGFGESDKKVTIIKIGA